MCISVAKKDEQQTHSRKTLKDTRFCKETKENIKKEKNTFSDFWTTSTMLKKHMND